MRDGQSQFLTSHIDPFLCTHINYAFAYVTADGTGLETHQWNDVTLYGEVNALKSQNPKLKAWSAHCGIWYF